MGSKKKNPFLSFIKGLFIFLLIIVLILGLWCGFSALHKKSFLSLLPTDFSLYLHTDSVWDALNPIVDLEVADVVLAMPEFNKIREGFIAFRQSSLRTNKLVAMAASRPVDIGVYMDGETPNVLGIVDLGVLSAATRLSKIVLPWFKIEGLSLVDSGDFYYFEFSTGKDSPSFYLKPYRNNLLFSTSKELLIKSCLGNHDEDYTKDEKTLIKEKSENPIKIIADARGLVESFAGENESIKMFSGLLSEETKALVSFGLTDSEINLKVDIPLEKDSAKIDSSMLGINNLLQKNSSMPQIISQLSDIVQYYTIINAGSLEEMTQAVFPLLPKDVDIDSLWKNAGGLCKTLFSVSIEDLLFSWTGKECAAIGIEGLNAPVFVLQIKDEVKRKEVFDSVLSSIILKDDTSLILNGVRLPKISLPGFLQNLLKAFGIELPNPYYLVHNGFIYFSESPEVLSTVYNSSLSENKISSNINWETVSEKQSLDSLLSLFYDLERSEPFFVRGNNIFSKILELYTIGRCDVRVSNSVLSLQLTVAKKVSNQVRSIPGYPIQLEGYVKQLQVEKTNNPSYIFWVENDKEVKSMNITSREIKEMEMSSKVYIVSGENTDSKTGTLWAVTLDGAVYNLNSDLTPVAGFPVLLGSKPSASPSAIKDGLIIPLENKTLCQISTKAEKATLPINAISGSVLANPTVLENKIAYYDKGFLGKVNVLEGEEKLSYQVTGIGYGSPALLTKNTDTYTAFISQAGNLTIWCDNFTIPGFPLEKKLNGVFYSNVVSNGNYFYALASHGTLYRISLDGELIAVRIPNATAKEGTLTVAAPNSGENPNIYVGIDGNVLYGFNENLELLLGFPTTGCGSPVFADVNGDGKTDCFALTIDNKLNAWNLR